MDSTFLGYAAGFIDGEGCLTILARKGREHAALLVVANNDRRPLDLFREAFGGSIHKVGPRGHAWHLSGAALAALLPKLEPLLIVKRRQANLLMEFFQAKGEQGRATDEHLTARQALLLRARELNRHGEPSAAIE